MDSLQHVQSNEFSNWLDVDVAVSVTTKGMFDYFEATIRSLHNEIKYGSCAALSTCDNKCSMTEQNSLTWCPTCIEWRKQIMNNSKQKAKDIKWKNINSSNWPCDINEMVKVFAPGWWDPATESPYTEDMTLAFNIIKNCKKFNIQLSACERVKDVRDSTSHGEKKRSEAKKNEDLKSLIGFLKLPEFSSTTSGKKAISELENLETHCVLNLAIKDKTIMEHLKQIRQAQADMEAKFLAIIDNVTSKDTCLLENNSGGRTSVALQLVVLVVGILLAFYWVHLDNTSHTQMHKDKVCLPLTLSSPCPWETDFTFDGYLKDRPVLYGRQWLIDKIQTSLNGTSSRGVLLTAEMGYGKTTLVSNLLCNSEFPLRKFILSYHICKFDVISTQRPEYFIKTLAGMLISHIPEAGNAILTYELGMKFLETSKCSEDPIGCLDAAIIHPLRGLQFNEERYVIIDAIDECGDSAAIAIPLLDVLAKRMSKMPWWLKFFITARDIKVITDKFSRMDIFHESSETIQNQDDISTFLTNNLFTHTTALTRMFGAHTDIEKVTKQILVLSGSNFLYVDLAVKYWIEYPDSQFTDIPQSLSELYNANLERVFGDNLRLYDLARKVFEVLCTSHKQLSLDELETIVNVTEYPYDLRSILRNQMSHFVEHTPAYITVHHKGVCEHLVSNTSVLYKYRINKQNGHRMFGAYLLGKQNLSGSDILDVSIHVAESNDSDLLYSFQHSQHVLQMKTPSSEYFHQMARTKNSYQGTKLLLKILGNKLVDNVTSANVTASFLAAAFGHSETLRALIEEGKDYSFRVAGPPNRGGLEDAVNHCKYKTLWGYGLLDIAAQNGHVDVVNLLLSKNISLIYRTNGLHLTAVHLAAEHGHTEILQKFLTVDSSLANQRSLYLASKNGHLGCVLALLRHGAEDTCIPCGNTIPWITNNTKRMQWDPCGTDTLVDIKFILNDDENLIKCSTALEIAIQRGHTKIAVLLLSQGKNAFNCREYGGRSPILTAIKYNQSDIFDVIFEKGRNMKEKCKREYDSATRLSLETFNENEKTILEHDMCPLGAGVEHFLAMHGRTQIFINLKYRGVALNWTETDEFGSTPLHYAACNNKLEMIQYMVVVDKVDIYIPASNGSLPIHSAVMCNAIMSYIGLSELYSKDNIELVDNEGRGLFHYLALGTVQVKDAKHISVMLRDSVLKTSTKDTNNSSYLHYAAKVGNHRIILYLSDISNASLLLEPDNMNKTVIDVAFDYLPYQEEYRICKGCSLQTLWDKQLDFEYDEVLSKEELVIYRIFHVIANFPKIQMNVDVHKYQKLAIMNGNAFIFLSIILFQPRPLVVDRDLLEAFFSTERPPIGMLGILSEFTNNFCDSPFEISLLHRAIRNEHNKYWLYWVHGNEFVNILRRKPATFWDSCYDTEGTNLLQHAVMGGNSRAVSFLIDYGMAVYGPMFTSIDLVSLGVSRADILEFDYMISRPWVKYTMSRYVNGQALFSDDIFEHEHYSMTKNFDNTTFYVISKLLREKNFNFSDFCNTNSKHLSLVHRAAIKGHVYTLAAIHGAVGIRGLSCENMFQFTSLYFAKLFGHSDVIKLFERKHVGEIFPHKMAELVVLQNLALGDDFRLDNVPPYVDLVVRLTHPYMYPRNPTHIPMLKRALTRLCFDAEKTLNLSVEDLSGTHASLGVDLGVKIVTSMCNLTVKMIMTSVLRYNGQAKKAYYSTLKTIVTAVRAFHQLYTAQQYYSYLTRTAVSAFHSERITKIIEGYAKRLSLQDIKYLYAFKRKFLTETRNGYYPSQTDMYPDRPLTGNSGEQKTRMEQILSHLKELDLKDRYKVKVDKSTFPLHN